MPTIPSQYRRKLEVTGGGQENVELSPEFSHHSVSVEGAGTGAFTLQVLPFGLTEYRAFDDNTLSENGTAVFALGSISGLRLVPTTAGVDYAISVSSY
jgi:hypothetical protein